MNAILRFKTRPGKAETRDQIALFAWAGLQAARYPGLDSMFAIPNGAFLQGDAAARAKRWKLLQRQGARAGVADIFLPVARGPYHGLWIELKAPPPHAVKISPAQNSWLNRMVAQGYRACVCRGCDAAIAAIKGYYLNG